MVTYIHMYIYINYVGIYLVFTSLYLVQVDTTHN